MRLRMFAVGLALVSLLGGAATATAETPSTAADTQTALAPGNPIRSWMNGKCLEIFNFNNSNGAPVGMYDCWGTSNQLWYWSGSTIRSDMNNKCLEVLNSNPNNFAPVGMNICRNTPNQRWTYTIWGEFRSALNGKCLEILFFNNDNFAPAGMYDCVGGNNQLWY
jgi:ricin-type beta-trefoil lectin protein